MLSKLFWLALAGGLAVYAMNGPGRRYAGNRLAAGLEDFAPDGLADESPNAAERLQQTHQGGAYAGLGARLPDGGQDIGLLPAGNRAQPPKTQGGGGQDAGAEPDEQPAAPGLGEMFRGA